MAIILGIDPGSRITGFGIINAVGHKVEYVASGCIRVGDGVIAERLKKIYCSVDELIELHTPQEFAIEQVFMGKNADSALKLGQARGAAILAASMHDLDVAEYAPRLVKQAVVGKGSAGKESVQFMVQKLLSLPGIPQADAADALAIALCHAHTVAGEIRQLGRTQFRRGRVR